MEKHFCTCTDMACPFNPNAPISKHKNCDLCIKKCLKGGEIPACFFKDIHGDTSHQTDYSYEGFCKYFAQHGE